MTTSGRTLYGAGWVDALVRLYHERTSWDFADDDRRDGYSVVLFGPHGPRYRHPPDALVTQVQHLPGVSTYRSRSTRRGNPSIMPCRREDSGSP